MKEKQIVLQPDVKESGVSIIPPEGCEVEKIEIVNGFIAVTFKSKEPKLPRSWEEFCGMFPMKLPYNFAIKKHDLYSDDLMFLQSYDNRLIEEMEKFTGDRATAEAVLALCQLIQLRNCYNGDWIPDWGNGAENKYCIDFAYGDICICTNCVSPLLLYFKSKELRNEFRKYFRPLIEKLKPLYGIREEVE